MLGTAETILDSCRARNIAEDPIRRFLIDPHDHLAAIRAARSRSLDVVGAYHSHPRSAAVPSHTDATAAFEHFLFVIVGLGVNPPEVTAWRWAGGNFTEVALVPFDKG